MARRIYLLAPSAIAFLIFGCGGGSDPGLFGASGVSGASSAGASSVHGAGAGSTPPASGGDTADAGSVGLGGSDAGGESSGGSNAGGSSAGSPNTGGSADGEGGHSASGGSVDQAGGGSAGLAEGGGAGHAAGGASTGGSAGAGTAGSAGSGAGGGSGEPTCAQLLAQAASELTAARACNLAVDAEQCTGAVETVCNCQVPVEKNGSLATKSYEATLKQLDAKHCSHVCPAIACAPVLRATCRADGPGTTKGSCVAGFGVPTPVPAF